MKTEYNLPSSVWLDKGRYWFLSNVLRTLVKFNKKNRKTYITEIRFSTEFDGIFNNIKQSAYYP